MEYSRRHGRSGPELKHLQFFRITMTSQSLSSRTCCPLRPHLQLFCPMPSIENLSIRITGGSLYKAKHASSPPSSFSSSHVRCRPPSPIAASPHIVIIYTPRPISYCPSMHITRESKMPPTTKMIVPSFPTPPDRAGARKDDQRQDADAKM